MNIKVASYNCGSIDKNIDIVRILLGNHDIVLLQETLLTKNNLVYLDQVDQNFDCIEIPSIFTNNNFYGRSRGGLAIFWACSLSLHVQPLCFNNDRIVGLKLNMNGISILIINVYMPTDYQNLSSLSSYRSTLADISDIL